MQHRVLMRGPEAEIRWAYHKAADLGAWTLETTPATTTFSAQVRSHDAYKTSQQPLRLLVRRPHGVWTWPIVSLSILDGTCTATLGQQEA